MLVTSKVIQAAPEGEALVVVQIRPGVGIKMRESEARARGLWPPPEVETKAQRPMRNKKRVPDHDKAGE